MSNEPGLRARREGPIQRRASLVRRAERRATPAVWLAPFGAPASPVTPAQSHARVKADQAKHTAANHDAAVAKHKAAQAHADTALAEASKAMMAETAAFNAVKNAKLDHERAAAQEVYLAAKAHAASKSAAYHAAVQQAADTKTMVVHTAQQHAVATGQAPARTSKAPTRASMTPEEAAIHSRGLARLDAAEDAPRGFIHKNYGKATDPHSAELKGLREVRKPGTPEQAASAFSSGHDHTIRQIDGGVSRDQIRADFNAHLASKHGGDIAAFSEHMATTHPHMYDPARGGKPIHSADDWIDRCQGHRDVLHATLQSQGKPVSGPVHRGMKGLTKDQLATFIGGDATGRVGLGGISSTSRSMKVGKEFDGGNGYDRYGVVVSVHGVRRGVEMSKVSHFKGEKEILVGGDERFRVGKVRRIGPTEYHVELHADD